MNFSKMMATTILLAVLTGPVAAEVKLVDATDPAVIQDLASGYGSAQLTTDGVGDPLVKGRINGTGYQIYFYDCTDGKDCRTIQFSAGWTGLENVTAQMMEKWNQDKRFATAFLDTDGDPNIQWDVNLYGGVSLTNMDDTIDWWALVLNEFSEYIQ